MNTNHPEILLGSLEGPHLILRPLEMPQKNIDPEYCCPVEVTVTAGNFKGSSWVTIEVGLFQQLHQALYKFSVNPVGEFTFSSIAREFWASVRGNNSGKFEAYCVLDDNENKYTRLRFKVEFGKKELKQSMVAVGKLLSSLEITPSNL